MVLTMWLNSKREFFKCASLVACCKPSYSHDVFVKKNLN